MYVMYVRVISNSNIVYCVKNIKIFQSGNHFTILKYQSHANDDSIILTILFCLYNKKNHIS